LRFGFRQAVERALQPEVLAAGEERVECRLLQRGADRRTHLGAFLHDVVPCDDRGARGRRQQGCEHMDCCGLPCAVRAQEAIDLPGRHGEIDSLHCVYVFELANEPPRLDSLLDRH
jgi:hypothetical protein